MSTWTSECNGDRLIPDLSKAFSTLSTSYTSMGSPQTDYQELCSEYDIRPCPHVQFSLKNAVKVCQALNCRIDISSWRAMLLAMFVADPPVEIVGFHGSWLTDSHVADLVTLLEKKHGTVTSLKLDYVTFVNSDYKALGSLLSCGVPYINLASCHLPDSFIQVASQRLPSNIHLQALTLNDNEFTDEGVEMLVKSLFFNVVLKHLSLKRNAASGSCLDMLGQLLTGRASVPEDTAILKTASKAVADKNKSHKDGAKARKAAGLPDIPDFPLPDTRVVKAGATPADTMVSNRQMAFIDVSGNPFLKPAVTSLVTKLSATEPALITATPCSTNIVMKNVVSESDKKDMKISDIGKGIVLDL